MSDIAGNAWAALPRLVAAWVAWTHGPRVFSRFSLAWRRRRYRPTPGIDALQAAIEAHATINAPHGALAAAVVTPQGIREFFANRVAGSASPAPDSDTRFEIGSITKTFTATLLSVMSNTGSLALDDTLDALSAPDERLGTQSPRPITLLDLATHRSGLPRLPWGLPMLAGMLFAPSQPYRFLGERALARWLHGRRVRHVGAPYRYSNLGYTVLGRTLARQAGLDYITALRRFVLEPLNMRATRADADHGAFAQPHTALGKRTPAWRRHGDLQGAGGLRSSLTDMLVWLGANMRVLAPIDARSHAPIADTHICGRRIALGWHVDGVGDATVIWHNGATGGSRSFIAFAPAHGVGIVVLSAQAVSVDALGIGLLNDALRIARGSSTPG